MSADKKTRLLTFVSLGVAFVVAVFYPYAFFAWNVPVFVACQVGFAVSAVLLSWAFFVEKGKKRDLLWGALCGVGEFVVTFGLSTILSAVLGGKKPIVPFAATSFLHAVYYVVFLALVCVNSDRKKILTPIVGGTLVACVIAVYVVGALIPSATYKNIVSYAEAVRKARTREYMLVPDQALKRTEPDYDKNVKLFINIDETSQIPDYVEYLSQKEEIDEDDLLYYVKPYYGTQVTDVVFSICGQTSLTPSEYITWRGDKVKQTEENGKKVDYSDIPYCWYDLWEKDIDPVPTWIKGCRENNINPWLSVRMNDCHDSNKETSFLRGDLFYEAQKNGWMIGEEYGYYHTCLDYSVPQIREIMLSYLREQLLRCDAYGIELDWMREIYCFDYLHADNEIIVGIMNDFMRKVNVVVEEAEEKWGHDLKITVRLMRDIRECKTFGFDVVTWEKEGLIDSVTVTPRFTSCDSDMDVAYWKRQLPSVEVYAGIETLVRPDGVGREGAVASAEVARGYAAEYLGDGADGIYFFNYYAYPYKKRNADIYNSCGNMRTAYASTRRHVMTCQDIVPEGEYRYRPLPVAALKKRPATLVQKTGYIPEGAKVNVYVGFATAVSSWRPEVTVCGSSCSFKGKVTTYAYNESEGEAPIPDGYAPEGSSVYLFSVDDLSKLGNAVCVTVQNNGLIPLIVTYLEIEVVP